MIVRIGVINYRMGNIRSVVKAFEYLGAEVVVCSNSSSFKNLSALVLPGVGAFGPAVANLKEMGAFDFIGDWLTSSKPFLGICLGLQLLFSRSKESLGVSGLGYFDGEVMRLPNCVKVPHIGWAMTRPINENPLFIDMEAGAYFYYVHSYIGEPTKKDVVVATCDYGTTFASAIVRDNCYAVQFHPEKSGDVGLKMLSNFLGVVKKQA
ncbi:MAG: imidazole glycerol phosphate synthase subunit HisH [Actinobacteria bacterium]|nr:imidazole glycerol phosphate synthase subunit HisH [Actinomycetota bacterium]